MTSYLIDLVLLAALVFTSWRTGRMHRQILALKRDERELARMLETADRAINEAAHSLVVMKGEGVDTVRALGRATAEAQEAIEGLQALVGRADWHAGRGAASRAEVPGTARPLERRTPASGFAPASGLNAVA